MTQEPEGMIVPTRRIGSSDFSNMISTPQNDQSLPPLTPLTPRSSRSSSIKSKLTLNLTDLPPLIQPAPPSNALIITQLDNLALFQPQNLQTIRDLISQHVSIFAFSPLKSFRRIIVSFYDIPSASFIKETLDGAIIMDCRPRIYYGVSIETSSTQRLLEAPKADKLFFISPPPSPPHDWQVRSETAPNKQVHAHDLAQALAKLDAPLRQDKDVEMESIDDGFVPVLLSKRSRTATLVYHPEQHGNDPLLPAISVEDTSAPDDSDDSGDDGDEDMNETSSPISENKKPITNTCRPPIELNN